MSDQNEPKRDKQGEGDESPEEEAAIEERDLTGGSVARKLFQMAGPMLVGMVAVMSMSIVDTFFVGQLGTLPLAAMSYSFPVIFFVGGISTGLGTAAASTVSRAVGADDEAAARRLTTHALLLALSIVVVLLVSGFPFLSSIFGLLGASGPVMPLILEYMTIWMFGMLFFVGPVVGTSALRARGDARTPMLLMVGGTIINAVLDPMLIFGFGPIPGLGIQGAALATAIARGLMTAATLGLLINRRQMRGWGDDMLASMGKSWRALARIGGPASATNVIVPVTTAILTRMVSAYGEPAVAAYGAGSRIESLAILVYFALSSGLGPVVGQSWGAGLVGRVRKALNLSQGVAFGWGVVSWVAFAGAAPWIASAFTEGPEAAAHLEMFLWLVPLGHGLQGVFYVCNGTLNAIDRPIAAGGLSFTRTLVLTAPLAWVGSQWFGVEGIFGSIALANALVGVAAFVVTRYLLRVTPAGKEN
jgi:putative MATE family efflux protein